ncbi:MAG: Peptidase and chymotrypsin/Hap, partial [Nocardioides sp.]|nr:Peptidase and chymotrypsin/Hap [Nocardioides sp.]
MNDDDQRPEPGPDQPAARPSTGPSDRPAEGDGAAETESTLPLSFARPTEPPAPSWVPPTTQAPPLHWAPFPPPGTQPLQAAPAQHAAPRGRVPGWIW